MKANFSGYIRQAKIEKTKRERIFAVLVALSILVTMVVSWQLRQTGITIAGDLVAACGYEEHTHTDACYELQCALEQQSTTEELAIASETDETAEHIHTDECNVLVCTKTEHTHDTTCFSDPTSDLVYQKDWEQEISELALGYNAADGIVLIASSQLGYKESATNFITDADFERHGYTKYAHWYGGESYWYYDWSAIFASFCLYYAYGGETAWDFTANESDVISSTVAGMVDEAAKADYYHDTSYAPVKGDMVVFKSNSTADEYIGIVTNITGNTISLISGDIDNEVKSLTIDGGDSNGYSVTGYIEIPASTVTSNRVEALADSGIQSYAAGDLMPDGEIKTGKKQYRLLTLAELGNYINKDTPLLVFAKDGNNYYALGEGGLAAGGLGINVSASEGGTTTPTTTTVKLLEGSYSFSSWNDNSIPDGIKTTNEVTSVSAGGVITVNYTINGSVTNPQLQIYHGNWTTGGTLILTGCNEYGAYDVTGGTSVSFTLTADQATLINNNKNGDVLFQLKAPGLTITSLEYTYTTTGSTTTGDSTVTGVPQNADLYKWKITNNNGFYSLTNYKTDVQLSIYPDGNYFSATQDANFSNDYSVKYDFTGGYDAAFAQAFVFVEDWNPKYLENINNKEKYIPNGSGLSFNWTGEVSPGAVATSVYNNYVMTTHIKRSNVNSYWASVFVGLPDTDTTQRQDLWNGVTVAGAGDLIGTTGLQIAINGTNKVKIGVFNGNAGNAVISNEISLPDEVDVSKTVEVKVIYTNSGDNGAITVFVGGKYIATVNLGGKANNVNMLVRGEGNEDSPYTYVQRTCYTSGTIYTCDGQELPFSDKAIAVPNAATGDGTVGFGNRGDQYLVVQDYAMTSLESYSYESYPVDEYSTRLYVSNSNQNQSFDYVSYNGAISRWPLQQDAANVAQVYFAVEEEITIPINKVEAAAENIEMHLFNYGAAINDYTDYTTKHPGTVATQVFDGKTYSGFPFYAEHSYGDSVDGTISYRTSAEFYGEQGQYVMENGEPVLNEDGTQKLTDGYIYTGGVLNVYPYRLFTMIRCLNTTGYPTVAASSDARGGTQWENTVEPLPLDFLFDTDTDFRGASAEKKIYNVSSYASGDTDNKFFNERTLDNIYLGDDNDSDSLMLRSNAAYPTTQTYDPVTNPNYVSKHFEVTNSGEGTGLFQINKDGFYYYNSAENAAYFQVNDDGKTGKFELYDYTLIPNDANAENADLRGNFLPFNKGHGTDAEGNPTGVWLERGRYDNPLPGKNSRGEDVGNNVDYGDDKRIRLASFKEYMTGTYTNAAGETVNYDSSYNNEHDVDSMRDNWFGMTMEFDFYMPEDGQVVNPNDSTDKNDMIFRFSGDDDVLVYIDGVLVLDISGTHPVYNGSINFESGLVTYTNSSNSGGTSGFTYIRDQFDAAVAELKAAEKYAAADELQDYIDKVFEPDGKTFKFRDYTKHTLNFYYLERGGNVSNCSLEFNIAPVPKGQLVVAKEITDIDGITSGADNHQSYEFQLIGLVSDYMYAEDGILVGGHGPDNEKYSGAKPLSELAETYLDLQPEAYTVDVIDANGNTVTETRYGYKYEFYAAGSQKAEIRYTDENGKFYLKNGENAKFVNLISSTPENRYTYGVWETDYRDDGDVEGRVGIYETTYVVNEERPNGDVTGELKVGTQSFTFPIQSNVNKTLLFRNIPSVNLDIVKQLEGKGITGTEEFEFTLEYEYTDPSTNETVEKEEEVILNSGNEYKYSIKLPLGADVKITELTTAGYQVAINCNGVITKSNVYDHFLTSNTTVTFINTKGVELPSTGGIGAETVMYLGGGICLTTLIYGFSRKRKRERRFM